MDALSLLPLLRGETDRHRDHVVSALGNWRAVLDGRYKFVTGVTEAPVLYDLEEDPWEDVDIASQHPDEVERLQRLKRFFR